MITEPITKDAIAMTSLQNNFMNNLGNNLGNCFQVERVVRFVKFAWSVFLQSVSMSVHKPFIFYKYYNELVVTTQKLLTLRTVTVNSQLLLTEKL